VGKGVEGLCARYLCSLVIAKYNFDWLCKTDWEIQQLDEITSDGGNSIARIEDFVRSVMNFGHSGTNDNFGRGYDLNVREVIKSRVSSFRIFLGLLVLTNG
jgi:hypothetical protein